MNFQGAVGNNLVPMMVFVSPEQLSMLNAGSVTDTGVSPTVTNIGIGNVNNSKVTITANADKSNTTNNSTESRTTDADKLRATSHTNDAVRVNDSGQVNNTNSVSNSAILVENSSLPNESLHAKASTSDKTGKGNTLDGVEMNHENDNVSESKTNTTGGSEVPMAEGSDIIAKT